MVFFTRTLIIAGLLIAPKAALASDAYLSQVGGYMPANSQAFSSMTTNLSAESNAAFANAKQLLTTSLASLANLPTASSNVSGSNANVTNIAEVVQSGKNNTAMVEQTGVGNLSFVVQQGVGNTAIVSQSSGRR